MGVGRSLPCCFIGKATNSIRICAFSFLCLSSQNGIGEGSSRRSGTQSAAGLLILASSMGAAGKTCNTAFRQSPTLTSTRENQETRPRQKNPEQVKREGFILRLFRTLVWEVCDCFKCKCLAIGLKRHLTTTGSRNISLSVTPAPWVWEIFHRSFLAFKGDLSL